MLLNNPASSYFALMETKVQSFSFYFSYIKQSSRWRLALDLDLWHQVRVFVLPLTAPLGKFPSEDSLAFSEPQGTSGTEDMEVNKPELASVWRQFTASWEDIPEKELCLWIRVRLKHNFFKLEVMVCCCFRKRHFPGDSGVQPNDKQTLCLTHIVSP